MHVPVTLQVILLAVACAGAAGAVGLLVARIPLRANRSVRSALVEVAAVAVACVAAGVAGAARAMFISGHDLRVVLQVTVVAALVAFLVAAITGRGVVRDVGVVRRRAAAVGRPDPAEGPGRGDRSPRLADLAQIDEALRAAARRLADGRRREVALEASRRELVAWVSHDLRTPLAGLRAMAEALEDGVAPDPHRYHKQIAREVDRLSQLVGDLFELSRIQAGAFVVDRGATARTVDLREIVHDVVQAAQARAHTLGAELSLHASPLAGAVAVHGDSRGLGRAVGNVVANAVTYSGPGGTVRVSLSRTASNAVVTVADTCGGIPEGDLERIFEPGWRAAASRTPGDDGGAGLGTAIARGIVRAHGGEVSVVNTGPGCRFDLVLPIAGATTPE